MLTIVRVTGHAALVGTALAAAAFGVLFLVCVIFDIYPVVPAEGFSATRKTETVLVGAVWGGALGFAAGAAIGLVRVVVRNVRQ